jgi:hypothetical protein
MLVSVSVLTGDDIFVEMQGGLPTVKIKPICGFADNHLASLCFWVSLFSMEVTSLHHIPNHWVSR